MKLAGGGVVPQTMFSIMSADTSWVYWFKLALITTGILFEDSRNAKEEIRC